MPPLKIEVPVSDSIIHAWRKKDKDMGKRKNGGRRGKKNAVPPSAVGAYIPVTKAWKAGLGFLSRPPITAPAVGLYPPGQHHKSAPFHVPVG